MNVATALRPRYGLSAFAALVDVQPDRGIEDDKRWRLAVSQCAGCSLVDFLRLRSNSVDSHHPVLASIVAFFDCLPRLVHARETGNVSLLRAACASIGARRVFVLDEAEALDTESPLRSLDLPRVYAMGKAGGTRLRSAEWVLVRPDRDGADRLRADIAHAVRDGVTRVLIGYACHSAAMDHWSDFAGAPAFPESWQGLVRAAWALGVTELVMLMPYPPCAILQWRENRPLEALRARLDLQLRRAGAESSMMCPENVSGYALYNDTRSIREGTLVPREVFGVRFEDLLILL